MKTETNRFIAKEILILFGTIILIILFYFSVHIRNFYFNKEINKNSASIAELEKEKESYPKDKILKLYEVINDYLVEYYEIEGDTCAMFKKHESDFLKIANNCINITNSNLGYRVYNTPITLYDYGTFDLKPTYLYDYVEFSEFKEKLRNDTYKMNLYNFLYKTIKYDSIPKEEFLKKIEEAFKHYEFTNRISEIDVSLSSIRAENIEYDIKVLSNSTIYTLMLKWGIIFLIITFPIRYFILLVIWSVKIMKNR